MLPGEADR